MDRERVEKVCWASPLEFLKGPIVGLTDPRIVTLILLGTVGCLYLWLR
jgi:hypothetical protein